MIENINEACKVTLAVTGTILLVTIMVSLIWLIISGLLDEITKDKNEH